MDFEFIYLLEWPDTETMERQWQAFLADPEWNEIKQDSRREAGGEPVLSAKGRVLGALEYGPLSAPGERLETVPLLD